MDMNTHFNNPVGNLDTREGMHFHLENYLCCADACKKKLNKIKHNNISWI